MKLYRSKGSVWTGTQSDARKAEGGPDFETIEVPTDKPGLMAFLNTFDVRPAERQTDLEEFTGTVREGVTVDDIDDILGGEIIRGIGNAPPVSPTACPACAREAKSATMVTTAMAIVCARGDLMDISDPDDLDDLIARAQARKASLTTVDPLEGLLG